MAPVTANRMEIQIRLTFKSHFLKHPHLQQSDDITARKIAKPGTRILER